MSYKSSNFRKSQPANDSSDKFRAQAKQLQEAFPTWSYDDLQSLLNETNGDVELASTRIIEGHAEQWGSVTRKKEKKPTSTSHGRDSSVNRERGDFRGGRGGRAARGGPRGGAARGASARGGHHEVNGHRVKPSVSGQAPKDASATDGVTPASADGETADADPDAVSAWGSSTPTTWGDTTTVNGTDPHPTAAPAAAVTSAPAPAQASSSAPAKAVSTPATSKLSWAQIARKPQEKPTPPPAPAPQPVPVSVPSPPPALAQQPEPTPSPEAPELATSTGWEEPTTVEAPTWDDEPRPPQQTESVSAPAAATAEESKHIEPLPKPAEEPAPERAPSAAPPGVVQQPAPASPAALPPKQLTPSISTRPTPISHRTNIKFKTTDQPVVLPASFGTGIEKIGMQFGSLSLGGEDFDAPPHESAPAEQKPVQPAAPEPAAAPAPTIQTPEPVAPVASPPSQTPLASTPLFQTSISQPSQPQPQQLQQPALPPVSQQSTQPTLPTSLSQPTLPTQTSLPSATSASSLSPYSQQSQPSLSSHQSQQPQSQTHHSYAQHGLGPSHLEQVQSQQQHNAPVSQQQPQQPAPGQNIGGPSSYFRQAEAPYFHTPTPPAGQSQESPYGAFGQLGQVQHQGQGSHLGNFGGGDYGYSGESQRNFYDSYSGPTGFGNRSVLGHDDIKGLPGSQQPHGAPGLPPSSAQSSQQHQPSSQGSQGQPGAGQGPQQYPPPLPYYYPPYPQNQYYGSPYNSGYNAVPQPFVKYPTVFQGPPGPQSAPSPATKQAPTSVQPASPYGQSLYGQQPHSNAYDDIGYQHHAQHAVGQNVNVSSGLPSGEYGKHQHGSLYGGSAQGIQGFMGLGQNSAPTSGPPLGQRAAAGSPENTYKPYGGNVGVKDVSAGVGVGQGGVGQGPQGRGGVQQPGQGSFYAQRFAASQAGGPQGQQGQQAQGQGPQGHLGYPQGGSDGSTFYSYQPRQQQGYWQ